MEFPHVMQLISQNQFDTIYHEHFSYLSFLSVKAIFNNYGLVLFDVDELPTHGGSLRIYAKHKECVLHPVTAAVEDLLKKEQALGMDTISYYRGFQQKAKEVKNNFLSFLLLAKKEGKTIAAYGAAAKGNTLLNYCGIKTDLIDFVVDASPYKQNKFLPGSHIPVVSEEILQQQKPDYVVIFAWRYWEPIVKKHQRYLAQGGHFIIPLPEVKII